MSYNYHDNRELLDAVLSKPCGVLSFLDEETKTAGNDHKNFMGMCYMQYALCHIVHAYIPSIKGVRCKCILITIHTSMFLDQMEQNLTTRFIKTANSSSFTVSHFSGQVG